jgi:Ala-tRNA(Pro) deacylase
MPGTSAIHEFLREAHVPYLPFGPLYGQTVFVDVTLASEQEIAFNAGTHTDAIPMRWRDFAKSVRPIVGKFAEPPLERAGEFKLSYRE